MGITEKNMETAILYWGNIGSDQCSCQTKGMMMTTAAMSRSTRIWSQLPRTLEVSVVGNGGMNAYSCAM